MRSALSILAGLVLGLALGLPAGAADLYVPGGYTTIQAAINAASPSDVVHVAAGTYHERLTVNKSLTLLGAQDGVDPTATGARTNLALESVVDLVGVGISNPNVLIEIPAGVTDVTISGFTILGSTVINYADESAIRCWDDRLTIQYNIIDGYTGVLYKGNDYLTLGRNRLTATKQCVVVQPNPATHVAILDNSLAPNATPDPAAQAIYITGTADCEVRRNTASGFPGGPALAGSNHTRLVIDGNTFTGTLKGVNIWGTTTFVTITHNVLSSSVQRGIDIKGQDIIIANNIVNNNGTEGISIDYHVIPTERVTIANNDLAGNTLADLRVGASVIALVDASANWWGTNSIGAIAGRISGTADYTPWLDVGTDTSGDPGFQGSFATLWVDDDSPQAGTLNRIQEGINLASGSTVYLAPGSYAGNVLVSQKVTLQGAGDGTNPLVDTILLPPAGTVGIEVQVGGTGVADRCVVRDLRVAGGGYGLRINNVLGYLTLHNLTVTGATTQGFEIHNTADVTDLAMTDVDLVSNVSSAMRVRGKLNGLAMTNGHIDGNVYGLQSYTDAGEGNNFRNIVVTGTTFDNNTSKGMYFEKLSDALFDGISVANSGTAGSWAAGIDINLKYAAYQNVEFRNSTLSGCGTGDLTNGVGIALKARDDGGYAASPATLANVDLVGCTFTGCQNAIRCGEPTKNNAGPTGVDIHQNQITGSVGQGLLNATQATPSATCNWWGDLLGPNVLPGNPSPGDGITGSAVYWPWWTTAAGPCDGYGANNIAAVLDTCISTVHPCETADMLFTRSDPTSMRGYSVTFHLSPELMLCSTPTASVTKGPYLSGPDGTMFQVVDKGGGSYTVDEAILGDPCVATGSGVLFRVRVTNSAGDGVGTIFVDSVTVRDCVNNPLPGTPGAPGSIAIDNTPSIAIADLAALQLRTGNDTDGTTKIQLTFTPPAGTAAVKVYRAGFGNYPEYDDPPGAGSVPATPSWPPPAPWALTGITATGQFDEVGNRDFWYFVAFAVDSCGNVSPVSNKTGGTLNYHLGDVHDGFTDCQGNNLVNTSDISFLGAHYAITLGVSDPLGCLDVGPTTDNYIHGRPKTDSRVQFEDMILFAINYSEVSKTQLALVPAASDELIVLVPDEADWGDEFLARLWVRGTGRVQGMSTQLSWNASAVQPVGMEPGELLRDLGGVAFSPGPGGVDAVLLGAREMGLAGEGELAAVRFRVIGSGDAAITIASLDARDRDNHQVEMGTRSDNVDPSANLPRVTALLANVPNPFNPSTKIPFTLSSGGQVELAIFTVDGRKIRTLVHGVRQPGLHETVWNGSDEAGSRVSSGAYYVRLVTRDGTLSRPVVLLK